MRVSALLRVSLASLALRALTSAQVSFPSLNSSPWFGQELLGRVGNHSVTVNVVPDRDIQAYIEYGTASGIYTMATVPQTTQAGVPLNIVLGNLQPNTRYYYRLQYSASATTPFLPRPEHSFTTQRPPGTPFTFLIQADPHLDANSSPEAYKLTLANELADAPDFMIDLGDNMLTDKLDSNGVPVNGGASPTAGGVLTRTRLHRSYYDLTTHSVPLFLALGNHEAEWGANLNGTPDNMAIWDTQSRNAYFPGPAPDGFFSGDTQMYDLNGNVCIPGQAFTCGLGQRRSYYAWEWGDALFVILDPYWNQTSDTSIAQAGNGKDCCQKGAGYWSLTLGNTQYNWLKATLEGSAAKYKFVFSHNLVGGLDPVVNGVAQGPMRGGVEAARYLEWGGYNLDGTWGFGTYRPGLPAPIHQLLVTNGVTAYFHGHDHLYAHQELDGIDYQEVPQPSAANANLSTRASDYGYTQGTLLGGRGYLRVQVSPAGVNVQYIETWLPAEAKGNLRNAMAADSYTLQPKGTLPVISRVANAASQSAEIAPNTWIEIDGTNLAPAGDIRTWTSADLAGNRLPAQLDGVSVTINGKPAYLSYISPVQINALTPPDALSGTASVQVSLNGVSSAVFNVAGKAASPAFFVLKGGPYIAATHADSTLLGPATLYPGISTPATPGETVVFYGNGFGATSSPVIAGSALQSGTLSPLPAISVGGLPAKVGFAGLVGTGLYQFNVTLPDTLPDGDQPVTATYNAVSIQPGTMLTIMRQ